MTPPLTSAEIAALRAMKTAPVAGHEGPAVTHKSEATDTLAVPRKLMTEAHAVMRACGWHLAPASATSDDGVIEAAAAEIEGQFAELIDREAADD